MRWACRAFRRIHPRHVHQDTSRSVQSSTGTIIRDRRDQASLARQYYFSYYFSVQYIVTFCPLVWHVRLVSPCEARPRNDARFLRVIARRVARVWLSNHRDNF